MIKTHTQTPKTMLADNLAWVANPVSLYLNSLAPTGRRSMRSTLQTALQGLGYQEPLEQIPWQQLGYQHVSQICQALRQQGKSASTINLTLAALKGVMRACFNLGWISADQLLTINAVKRIRGRQLPSGRSLTATDMTKLLKVCQQDRSVIGMRDTALLSLLLVTGLRRSEVAALQCDDLNTKTGLLTIRCGKGNRQRQIYLNPDSRPAIRQWRKYRGHDAGPLFNPINKIGRILNLPLSGQSIYHIVQQRAQQAKIGHLSPHDLRRTFVTRLLESGVDLNITRQLAGHQDIQTTVRYDLRDQKTQRQAIAKLSL